eukprot:5965663-Pyramimonas_sp.AAC.1
MEEPHEALRFAYAIPLMPPPAETPPMCPDFVHHWGVPELPWGGLLYLDGGGFGMDTLELARCSWALSSCVRTAGPARPFSDHSQACRQWPELRDMQD